MNNYKVYKAKVTKISIPDNQGETQRKIYVSPYPPDGSGTWERTANPPNVFPTNTLGSGLISYPEVGQECIVAEWRGERQILAYTQPRGLSPYGSMIPDNLSEGAMRFGIKGLNEALIKMTKEGQVTIYSHTFAKMGIDGSSSHVFSKGKSQEKEFFGGFERNEYDTETKKTASVAMYIDQKDNPVFSDHNLRIEESFGSPVPQPGYKYKNKAIIRSGYIADGEHPWELQTRQNIGANSAQDKNTVTLFRVGYQKEHQRYGKDQYPAGTMLELSAKKNQPSNVGLFKFRYGKLDKNSPNSTDRGEILSLYAYEGLNNGRSFGTRIIDAVGEGRGWGLDYGKKSEQVFIHSIGRLKDGSKSFKREYLKDEKEDFELFDIYGGENSVYRGIKHGDLEFSEVLNEKRALKESIFSDFKVKETLDKKWSIEYSEGSSRDFISIEKDKIVIENNSGDKIKLSNGEITLTSKNTEVEIDNNGFRVNGKALVFEDIISILSNQILVTAATPGTPLSMFPATSTQLNRPSNKTSN